MTSSASDGRNIRPQFSYCLIVPKTFSMGSTAWLVPVISSIFLRTWWSKGHFPGAPFRAQAASFC